MRSLSAALVVAMLALVALPAAAGNCAQYTCSDCIDESSCGWCSSSNTCLTGYSTGASSFGNNGATCSSSNWKYTTCSSSSTVTYTTYYSVSLINGQTGSTGMSTIRATLLTNFGVTSSYVTYSSSSGSSITFYFSGSGTAVTSAKNNLNAIISGTTSSSSAYKTKAQLGFSSVSSYQRTANWGNLDAVVTGLGTLLLVIIIGIVVGTICCIACCVYCCCIKKPAQTVIVQQAAPGMNSQVQGEAAYAPMPVQQGNV